MSRKNECGHPERKHRGHGMCQECYYRDYSINNKTSIAAKHAAHYARNKDRVREVQVKYLSDPKNRANRNEKAKALRNSAGYAEKRERKRIKDIVRRSLPEGRAQTYVHNHGCDYDEALKWMLVPEKERKCHMCGEEGKGLYLDHDHVSLVIRGWAHPICNTIEGYVGVSPNPMVLLERLTKLLGNPAQDK